MPRQSKKKSTDNKEKSNTNRRVRKNIKNKKSDINIKYRLRSSKILENLTKKHVKCQTCSIKDKRNLRNKISVKDVQVQTFPVIIVASSDETTGNVVSHEKEQLNLCFRDSASTTDQYIKFGRDSDGIVASTDNSKTIVHKIGRNDSKCIIPDKEGTINEGIAKEDELEMKLIGTTSNDGDEGASDRNGHIESCCLINEKTSNEDMDIMAERLEEESKWMDEMQEMDLTNEYQSMIRRSSSGLLDDDSFENNSEVDHSMSNLLASPSFGSKNELEDCRTNPSENRGSGDSTANNSAFESDTRTEYPGIFPEESGQAFYDSKHGAYVEPKVMVVESGSTAPKQSKLSWCSIKNMFVRGIYSQEQDNISGNKSEQ